RFCAKGRKCLHRHVWECPDWVEKNNCTRPKCKLPHPQKPLPKKTAAAVVSKDEEDLFIKQYVCRPVFGEDAAAESDPGAPRQSDDEDEYLSDEDLSGDEAGELLKWYDDNYVDETSAPN
ncbi:hypothetical protein GGI20_005771, partial [Coemansia sp. BCRC 34301]